MSKKIVGELKSALKDINKKLEDGCTVKEGDPVQWKNKEGKTHRGRVVKVWALDGELSIKVIGTADNYIHWSSNTFYFEDQTRLTVLEEPFDPSNLEDVDEKIRKAEKKIENAETALGKLKAERREACEPCVHWWDEGIETGETVKFLVGEGEKKRYECQVCGTVVVSV